MRRRILAVALAATAVAVLVFGIPLAVAVQRLLVSGERAELESLALRAASAVSPAAVTTTDPIELPVSEPGVDLAVYGSGSDLVSGAGPAAGDAAVTAAFGGQLVDRELGGQLVVAVPVSSGERVIGVVRAATGTGQVHSRVALAWAGMAAVAGVAVLVATAVAAHQARRLTTPLDRLAGHAADLGEGDFACRSRPSGIEEIDRTGAALDRTAERLGDLVARERAFSTSASHQLRTPLTGLRLRLESALAGPDRALRPAAEEAVEATVHMSRTVDDLLTLSRGDRSGHARLDVPRLLEDLRRTWTGPLAEADRPLRVRSDDPPSSSADAAAVRQILTVLVDNAHRHGRGAVSVLVRDAGDALAIDVTDEGSTTGGLTPSAMGDGAGIGLRLAQDLALGQGGRLVHSDRSPTRFTLYLPAMG